MSRRFIAFMYMSSMCDVHFKFWLSVIPRCLWDCTSSINVLLRLAVAFPCLSGLELKTRALILGALKVTSHWFDH